MNNQELDTHEEEVLSAITALGKALSTYAIYGIGHPTAAAVIDAAFQQFSILYKTHDVVNLGVVGGRFMVDGRPFSATNSLTKGLERKVLALGITNLTLRRGLGIGEFCTLIELLNQANHDKMTAAISGGDISNISSEDDLEYQLVHKGQTMVESPPEPEAGSSHAADDAEGPVDTSSPVSSVNVNQIVAFMKGEAAQDSSSVKDEVAKLASDPEKLGQLIVESVVMRQAVQSLEDTESLGDVVLGCLRKTFEGLKGLEAFQKRSGKASMKKAMLLLEKSIIDRIHNATGLTDPAQDKKIIKAIKNMRMDVDIENSLAKYSEQSAALQRSQEKIAGYVAKRGISDVKQVRYADEISKDEWRKIEMESDREKKQASSAGADGIEALSGNLGALAMVLEQLDELMKRDDRHENLDHLLGQAQKNLAEQSARTEDKISELGKRISQKEASKTTIEGSASKMTISELLYSISEIAQELSQPLTAIDVSLEMVLTGYVGPVPEEQRNILHLASTSGDHMGRLMEQLKDIVGMPKTLGTDKRFHHR